MFSKRGLQKNLRRRPTDGPEEPPPDSSPGQQLPLPSKAQIKKHRLASTTVKPVAVFLRGSCKTVYESNRSLGVGYDQKATAAAEFDTEHTKDHRAMLERNEKIGKAILAGELEEGIYRGMGAIRPIINKREGAISVGKHTGRYGPVRGSENVRMTMRIDLNPEICKDYKETGYCGFGDTCIFLHDRSDYKSGWQLEREFEMEQAKKQERLAKRLRKLDAELRNQENGGGQEGEVDSPEKSSDASESGEEEEVPAQCGICHEKWKAELSPVVTKCRHFFCEKCALAEYFKSSKCFSCKKETNGIFNSAAGTCLREKG